jgi:hypothetical protein
MDHGQLLLSYVYPEFIGFQAFKTSDLSGISEKYITF